LMELLLNTGLRRRQCGKSWRRTGAINHCTSFALWCRLKRAKGCIGAAGCEHQRSNRPRTAPVILASHQ
jgi:hypothetical protein